MNHGSPPDPDHLGNQLINLAPRIKSAKEHIEHEFVISDGAAAAQRTDAVHGNNELTAVEAVVARRAELLEKMYEINDCLDAVESINRQLAKLCTQTLGIRVPISAGRCYSSPQLAGYLIPLDDGGWFDPTCTRSPRSTEGQCDACRQRMARWRARTEQKPVQDERVVQYDSIVTYTERGVALVRPIRGAA